MSMLVIGILHANNWRDIVTDGERRVKTMASIFGDRGSLIYYGFLLFGSIGIVLIVYMIGLRLAGASRSSSCPGPSPRPPRPFHASSCGAGQAPPRPRQPLDFVILDGATAQYKPPLRHPLHRGVWIQALLEALSISRRLPVSARGRSPSSPPPPSCSSSLFISVPPARSISGRG